METSSPEQTQILTKRRLQDLLREIDPREQMDDDVEDVSANGCPTMSLFLYSFSAASHARLIYFRSQDLRALKRKL